MSPEINKNKQQEKKDEEKWRHRTHPSHHVPLHHYDPGYSELQK